MNDPIEAKVNKWAPSDIGISDINLQIRYLEGKLFSDYEPTKGVHPDFLERLNTWLENVDSDEDKKNLFRLVPNLFFIGRDEFDTLFMAAYNGQIARWISDQIGIYFDEETPEERLKAAIANTWICPITDSMRINGFYHVNNIHSRFNERPDWLSLCKFGSVEKIEKYLKKKNIDRIVLLEDFISSGTQVSKAIKFAAELPCKIPILVVPLLICPKALESFKVLECAYKHITFSPVISLATEIFILDTSIPNEYAFAPAIRDLVVNSYNKVVGSAGPHDYEERPYGPFGFGSTGGLIVMYSNCPNNTLPIVHHSSRYWNSLFPRSTRI